jgi:peptide-methionine (S)-S-oxide reductase
MSATAGKEIATLAGGCFWCLEAVYDEVKGVDSVESGYMGGRKPSPSYEEVCSGETGHAEVVQVTFDPKVVSYKELLEVFFVIHDPTTLNRQGNDVGTQYRSAIYPTTGEQLAAALASREAFAPIVRAAGHGEITTEIAEAGPFFYAEDYHQQYLSGQKNPGGYCNHGPNGLTCPVGVARD